MRCTCVRVFPVVSVSIKKAGITGLWSGSKNQSSRTHMTDQTLAFCENETKQALAEMEKLDARLDELKPQYEKAESLEKELQEAKDFIKELWQENTHLKQLLKIHDEGRTIALEALETAKWIMTEGQALKRACTHTDE